MRFIAVCICIGVMVASAAAVLVSLYVVEATANDGDLLNLDNIKLSYAATIKVRDPDTGVWVDDKRLVQEENREWVDLAQIPPDLQHAFIAIEDKDFIYHSGFSIKRTVSAVINEVLKKLNMSSDTQGASTINQQLIKNLTNDDVQDYGRKIREIFRAIALDNKYSKDIILEAYLNTIRLTGNVAGVQAGAHNYFDKRLGEDELSIAECASIAAITKDPTEYNPFTNPEKHLDRRNDVLYFMRRQQYITQEEYEQSLVEPLRLAEVKTGAASGVNTYAQDAVINDVIDAFCDKFGWTKEEANREFYNGGYTVYATYDNFIQQTMEQVMNNREMFPEFRRVIEKRNGTNFVLDEAGKPVMHEITTQAAMVILDYNGEVKGSVGGLGEKEKDRVLNRAMDMKRAVGSTMKGVTVYPVAIDQEAIHWSWTVMDDFYEMINDNGTEREWPTNYEESYKKELITIEEAVRRSVNTVAVRVGTDLVGIRPLFDFAYDTLQIKSLVPSDDKGDIGKAQMCLGALSHGMTPLELASAYMMYGNGGEYITPHTFIAVENSRGEVVLEPEIIKVQAIGEDTAYIMNRLLANVLGTGGTAPGIKPKTTDGVGKTGTTNETRDVWFAGVTPNYVAASWFGFDSNDPMWGKDRRFKEYYNPSRMKHPGASAWRDIMDIIQEGTENTDFEISENVEKKPYCLVSGANPGPLCTEQGTGYYKKGTELGACTAPGHY